MGFHLYECIGGLGGGVVQLYYTRSHGPTLSFHPTLPDNNPSSALMQTAEANFEDISGAKHILQTDKFCDPSLSNSRLILNGQSILVPKFLILA